MKHLNLQICIRHQGKMPGPFNGQGDFPLMFGAVSRNPPGNDFSPFRNKIAQGSRILVIDLKTAVSTKSSYFFSKIDLSF